MKVVGKETIGRELTAWGTALRLARRVAETPAPALVLGETGTGKEVVAQLIHECRAKTRLGAMVAVNCGAIPAEQVEFELFGHAKGAYTGVTAEGKGYVREAEGGTLFLDEIGELPLAAQAKLLRVLQEKRVRPMGGKGETAVDFRLVCATHCDLELMVRERRFREDLYNRIAVCDIRLPPLRERKHDIEELAEYFVQTERAEYGRPNACLATDAVAYLKKEWDCAGNTRGLQRLVRRALVQCDRDGLLKREHMDTRRQQEATPDKKSRNTGLPAAPDKKAAVIALARAHPELNAPAIGAEVGVTRQVALKWMKQAGCVRGVSKACPAA